MDAPSKTDYLRTSPAAYYDGQLLWLDRLVCQLKCLGLSLDREDVESILTDRLEDSVETFTLSRVLDLCLNKWQRLYGRGINLSTYNLLHAFGADQSWALSMEIKYGSLRAVYERLACPDAGYTLSGDWKATLAFKRALFACSTKEEDFLRCAQIQWDEDWQHDRTTSCKPPVVWCPQSEEWVFDLVMDWKALGLEVFVGPGNCPDDVTFASGYFLPNELQPWANKYEEGTPEWEDLCFLTKQKIPLVIGKLSS